MTDETEGERRLRPVQVFKGFPPKFLPASHVH